MDNYDKTFEFDHRFCKLSDTVSEIYDLRQAFELLKEVYTEVGPYGGKELSQQLQFKINSFFGFDDSE